MFTNFDQFVAANKASVDAMLSVVNTALSSAERMTTLNVNTARTLLDDGAANAKALLAAESPQQAFAIQAALAQPAVDQLSAYSRGLYEISAQTKDELAKVLDSQISAFRNQVSSVLDQAESNAPAGAEAAVATARSAFSAANTAFDTVHSAVKQASDLATANFAAASNETAKAAGAAANSGKRKAA